MTRSMVLAGSLALAVAGATSPGVAQPAPSSPKVLRTLVYSVQLTSKRVNEEQTSGFSAGSGAASMGNATTRRSANVDDQGTLTANVIAAAADGGLVVDASFAGKSTVQEPIRVAIFQDGGLSYAPGAKLSPEAARLLPMLARGIVAERDVSQGSTWSVPVAPPAKGAWTYHITAVSGNVATLGIDIDMSLPGPTGWDEHGKATALYDTARLCPTQYDVTTTSRHQPAMDQYVTDTLHLSATLVSDSFVKK
jgi:hypothetical protein